MYLRLFALSALIVSWTVQAQTPTHPHRTGVVPGIRPGSRDGGYQTPGLITQQAKLARMRIIEVIGETQPTPPAPGTDMGPVVIGMDPIKTVAPPVKANPPVAETLIARRWWNGRHLDDSLGRRWVLIHGAADFSRADQVPGWLLDSKSDVLHFLADNGRLWRLQYRNEKIVVPIEKEKK
jgi:hypothetical protein